MRLLLLSIALLISQLTFAQGVQWITAPNGMDSTLWEYADFTIPPGMRIDSVYGAFSRAGYPVDEEDFYFIYCDGPDMNCASPIIPFDYATENNSLYHQWIDLTAFAIESPGVIRIGLPTFTGAQILYDSVFYLPDGSGQNYESSVTISGFGPNDSIASSADVGLFAVNMEHSYLGDLEMLIECPNGQRATIFNSYDGVNDIIPGGFNGGGTYLGDAYDTNLGNPGIGWDYFFDPNNATFGTIATEFAGGNTVTTTISSGNAMNPNGVYMPEDDWSTLVGCPVNGTWKLITRDNLSIDDGYIFGWALLLDPANSSQTNALWDSVGIAIAPGITFSVNETLESNFSVYPNPANETLFVATADDNMIAGSIRLFDLSGREVMTQPLRSEINLSGLQSGLYLVRIEDRDGGLLHLEKLKVN